MGSGTVEGTETLEQQVLVNSCFNVTEQAFAWGAQGTYAGKTTDGQDVVYKAELAAGQALHDGPLKFTVDTHGPYYHGPDGTHGMTDSACSAATAGFPITGAVFTVFADGHVYKLGGGGAQVPCTGTGSWVRLGTDWHAQWNLDADCTVIGNAAGTPGTGVAKVQTVMTHHGTHDPCFGVCASNFELDYTEHPPLVGLHASLTGPATIAVNRTAAMTAVVSSDGAPLPAATVAFSVSGPAAATPSTATVTTGTDGHAAFGFSAGVEGNYVVTAVASSSAYPGQAQSASFTVFFSGPRPRLVLNGQPRAQNGDVIFAEAQLFDDSDPVANGTASDTVGNVPVTFSVAAPSGGQAVPASGSDVTDSISGRAEFNFTGTRAGRYTVTAQATYAGQNVTASDIVDFQVRDVSQVAAYPFAPSSDVGATVRDPAGDFVYYGTFSTTNASAAKIRKFDLHTFTQVGEITLSSADGEWSIMAAAIDPTDHFAYFGTGRCSSSSSCRNAPGRVIKVDLNTFQKVDAISLAAGEKWLGDADIDPVGHFAYFTGNGFSTEGAKVIKLDLATFQRVGVIDLPAFTAIPPAMDIDPSGRYGYLAGAGAFNGDAPGWVVKIDLSTMTKVNELELDAPEDRKIGPGVIDADWHYAYYASAAGNAPSQDWIVKIDLHNLERVGAVAVPYLGIDRPTYPRTGFRDPAGKFAYFTGDPNSLLRVELSTLDMVQISIGTGGVDRAFVDPAGDSAYFVTKDFPPQLLKVALHRTPKVALAAGNDSYATDYVTTLTVASPGVLANDADTEDADPLTAGWASDPAGGSATVNPDGSFTYTPDAGFSGTDTFTYQASDGIDVSPPATVSITVGGAPAGVRSVSGGACGYYTKVGLFGGPAELKGCGLTVSDTASASPSVTLPATGSGAPMTATKPEGAIAMYGPAALFGGIWPDDNAGPPPSGPQSARTSGTTGPGGSVTSSASVVLFDSPVPVRCASDPAGTANCTAPGGIGPGPLIAEQAHSSCTANESGLSGSATFVNGNVETKYDVSTQLPIQSVAIPASPPANLTVDGTLDHVGDSFRVVLNEQILGPDSITVNAAHLYLLGPTAVGELIVGQSRCGVDLATPNAAPVAHDDAYTATAARALVVPAAGLLANDTDADGQALRASTVIPTPPPASGGGAWTFPSDPAHGTLTLNPDGSFTYVARSDFSGTDSFTYLATDTRGKSGMATVTITVAAARTSRFADFDGNGSTDLSVFRPSTGAWFVGNNLPVYLGLSGDIAVPGDYDGNGSTDMAVFRDGAWYVGSNAPQFLGLAGDIPVPGDYDGNGTTDLAVFRPSIGAWYVGANAPVYLGLSGDIPVPGDYDGNGSTDMAVFRPSIGAWYVGNNTPVYLGLSGDIPVPADYDGNGTTDMAVFRDGAWYVGNNAPQFLGLSGDIPVPGNYSGTATTELATFRPSIGGWYIGNNAPQFIGLSGDDPVPLPDAIRRPFFG